MSTNETDIKQLKQRLPEYLKAIRHPPRPTTKSSFSALCPLHNDNEPSFSANLREGGWLWYCHACGVGGSIIDLHADLHKLDRKSNVYIICKGILEKLGNPTATQLDNAQVEFTADSEEEKSPLSREELDALTLPWRSKLFHDDALREKFAHSLGLPAELLKNAANNPHTDAMGIVPAGFGLQCRSGGKVWLREPRLAYIGEGYYKIRAPFGDARDPRFWMVGKPQRPWLSHWLVREHTPISHVHIHESESSALALVASGGWNLHGEGSSIVVATGGAGGFRPEWTQMFTGRTVHFWPDNDDKGAEFVEKTARLLHGTAREILVHDWNQISQAA